MGEVRSGLDPAWLDRAAARDPVAHAYALWDRTHEPDRVRFVSFVEGGETRAYLVIWYGLPGLPMVHWVGPMDGADALLDALPARPLLAVVPPEIVPAVRSRRGPIREFAVEIRVLDDGAPVHRELPGARRLDAADAPELEALRLRVPSPLLEGYLGISLERTPTFGAFEGDRLVAVAKASVVLRRVWVLTGIVVAPESRGKGHGWAVTSEAVRSAVAAGARPALYVRSDNLPATRLYDRLGFRVVARRAWLDAGGDREP